MQIRKTYRDRLYPTNSQAERLQWVLDRCRELYNQNPTGFSRGSVKERPAILGQTGRLLHEGKLGRQLLGW